MAGAGPSADERVKWLMNQPDVTPLVRRVLGLVQICGLEGQPDFVGGGALMQPAKEMEGFLIFRATYFEERDRTMEAERKRRAR